MEDNLSGKKCYANPSGQWGPFVLIPLWLWTFSLGGWGIYAVIFLAEHDVNYGTLTGTLSRAGGFLLCAYGLYLWLIAGYGLLWGAVYIWVDEGEILTFKKLLGGIKTIKYENIAQISTFHKRSGNINIVTREKDGSLKLQFQIAVSNCFN